MKSGRGLKVRCNAFLDEPVVPLDRKAPICDYAGPHSEGQPGGVSGVAVKRAHTGRPCQIEMTTPATDMTILLTDSFKRWQGC